METKNNSIKAFYENVLAIEAEVDKMNISRIEKYQMTVYKSIELFELIHSEEYSILFGTTAEEPALDILNRLRRLSAQSIARLITREGARNSSFAEEVLSTKKEVEKLNLEGSVAIFTFLYEVAEDYRRAISWDLVSRGEATKEKIDETIKVLQEDLADSIAAALNISLN